MNIWDKLTALTLSKAQETTWKTQKKFKSSRYFQFVKHSKIYPGKFPTGAQFCKQTQHTELLNSFNPLDEREQKNPKNSNKLLWNYRAFMGWGSAITAPKIP